MDKSVIMTRLQKKRDKYERLWDGEKIYGKILKMLNTIMDESANCNLVNLILQDMKVLALVELSMLLICRGTHVIVRIETYLKFHLSM